MKKFHIALIALFLAVIILPAAFVFAGGGQDVFRQRKPHAANRAKAHV